MNKFIKTLSLVNVLILAFTLSSCGSFNGEKYKKKYETFKALNQDDKVSKMKEEVEFMCTTLEKKHKNLYHSISKEEFKEKENQIINELPNIKSESEYYLALSELITSLKDAHTRVSANNLFSKELKYYGFNIEKFDNDKWILTGIGEENKDKLGYEIKSINNVDINEIYNKSLNFSPHENPYVFTNDFPHYVNTADILSKIKAIGDISDDILIRLVDSTGKEADIKVPAVDSEELSNLVSLSSQAESMETAYDESKSYWNKKLSDDIYYIQYNRCKEDSSIKMSKFREQVKSDIKDNDFKKVIIDLRYNGGGDSRVIEPLYDDIQRLEDEYKFKVYILIGNRTFSSALLNAYDGKNQLHAVLAGEPTGGNLNHYGEVKTFDLPYSGFTITYCVKYFENVKGYDKDALYPDIECPMSLDDYVKGIDTVVQAVIKD